MNDPKPAAKRPRAPKAAAVAPAPQDGNPVDWVFSLAKSERGHKRREAILKAAAEEFMQKGYQRASLRNIIRASGGSAETLYQQFGNKAGLFAAAVGVPREEHLKMLEAPGSRPVEEELLEIARAFLASAFRPDSIAFIRMMVGDSGAMPEISQMIWDYGPAGTHTRMADYFRHRAAAGVLDIVDPELAARQFIGVTRAGLDIKAICTGITPTPEQIEKQAVLGVRLFLNGVRAQER